MDITRVRYVTDFAQTDELIAIAKPFYFTHHHGQHAVASSVEARSADGKVVRVGFSNSYRGTSDEPAITRLAGETLRGISSSPSS